jgi:hypothetical protein
MNKVLILEDDETRNAWFRHRMGYAVMVETAKDCIAQLAAEWDVVYLDHDLGGEIYVDVAHENTGSAVVRWIAEHKPVVGQFVVHSANGPAAQAMTEDLERLGYRATRLPFWMLRESF